MNKVEFLSNEEMRESIKKVKEIIKDIQIKLDDCDKGLLDCEEVSFYVDQKNIEFSDYFSIYQMVKKFKNILPLKEGEVYDVRKIKISPELYSKMVKFDKAILKLFYKDFSKKWIDKEISWLHFMSGFSIDENLKGDTIILLDDVIRKDNNDK